MLNSERKKIMYNTYQSWTTVLLYQQIKMRHVSLLLRAICLQDTPTGLIPENCSQKKKKLDLQQDETMRQYDPNALSQPVKLRNPSVAFAPTTAQSTRLRLIIESALGVIHAYPLHPRTYISLSSSLSSPYSILLRSPSRHEAKISKVNGWERLLPYNATIYPSLLSLDQPPQRGVNTMHIRVIPCRRCYSFYFKFKSRLESIYNLS